MTPIGTAVIHLCTVLCVVFHRPQLRLDPRCSTAFLEQVRNAEDLKKQRFVNFPLPIMLFSFDRKEIYRITGIFREIYQETRADRSICYSKKWKNLNFTLFSLKIHFNRIIIIRTIISFLRLLYFVYFNLLKNISRDSGSQNHFLLEKVKKVKFHFVSIKNST